jgi:hypothetical protein
MLKEKVKWGILCFVKVRVTLIDLFIDDNLILYLTDFFLKKILTIYFFVIKKYVI